MAQNAHGRGVLPPPLSDEEFKKVFGFSSDEMKSMSLEPNPGKNIEEFRSRQGLSREVLAEQAGVTELDIVNMECTFSQADMVAVHKVLKALGVRPLDILQKLIPVSA